jgi:hypothetical protein
MPSTVIPGWPEGAGPESMNTGVCQALIALCSWIPGPQAVRAPRNDDARGFRYKLT